MSVRFSVMKMESMVAVPKEKRNIQWAHDVCTASRLIHIDVWRFCPEHKYVINKVISLLRNAEEELLRLPEYAEPREDERRKVMEYRQNLQGRIRNIEDNYLQGKPSAFRPQDKLGEPEGVLD